MACGVGSEKAGTDQQAPRAGSLGDFQFKGPCLVPTHLGQGGFRWGEPPPSAVSPERDTILEEIRAALVIVELVFFS